MTTAAWYIIPSKQVWARWVNILHLPYTLWHLSYVVLGGGLATELSWPLLGWMVLAFFLGMGVAAHCFDLVKGDPLRLGLQPAALAIVGAVALGLAVIIGAVQIVQGNMPVWLAIAIPVGVILCIGYNLEWPGMHGDWQFAAWWAVFPLLVGYFSQGIDHHPSLIMAVVFAFCTAYAQRVLSTRARYLRRKVGHATTFLEMDDGQVTQAGKDWELEPLDRALAWLSVAMVVLAGALVLWRTLA